MIKMERKKNEDGVRKGPSLIIFIAKMFICNIHLLFKGYVCCEWVLKCRHKLGIDKHLMRHKALYFARATPLCLCWKLSKQQIFMIRISGEQTCL